MLRQWRWCWTTCRRHVGPWQDHHLGQQLVVGSWYRPRKNDLVLGLVISRVIYLETSWAPVNKLNGSLGFDVSNRSINIFWNDVTAEEEAAGHVFTLILGYVCVSTDNQMRLKMIIYRDVGRIWPSGWLVQNRHWWFLRQKVVRGRLFQRRWLVRRWRVGSEYVGMGPS